jgi:hypothetical protein
MKKNYILTIFFFLAIYWAYISITDVIGYCRDESRFLKEEEYKQKLINRIVSDVSYVYQGIYKEKHEFQNKKAVEEFQNNVKDRVNLFFKNNPSLIKLKEMKRLFSSNDDSRYSGEIYYFFEPSEIEAVNRFRKKVYELGPTKDLIPIGLEYQTEFTNCGNRIYSMGSSIYKNNPEDVKFNPYNKDK